MSSMNKRRRSGSSVATISDESDEYATPERDASPVAEEEGVEDEEATSEEDEASAVEEENHIDEECGGSYDEEDDEPLIKLPLLATPQTPSANPSLMVATTGSGRKRKKLDPVSCS